MRRRQLFEFMDQAWLPERLRDLLRDQLVAADLVVPAYDAVLPLLRETLAFAETSRVVDLCSGTGGPARRLGPKLVRQGAAHEVVLTDLFPALDDAEPRDGLRVYPDPVNATAVPDELEGMRTLFNAFHHFPPGVARAMLADAADAGQPIVVFEILSRTPRGFLTGLGVGLISPLTVWALRPVELDRIVWNTVLPVVPTLLLWEGFASCLRVYQEDELRELTAGLGGSSYVWDTGVVRADPLNRILWLRGRPRESQRCA